jgi:hypothetical protein
MMETEKIMKETIIILMVVAVEVAREIMAEEVAAGEAATIVSI